MTSRQRCSLCGRTYAPLMMATLVLYQTVARDGLYHAVHYTPPVELLYGGSAMSFSVSTMRQQNQSLFYITLHFLTIYIVLYNSCVPSVFLCVAR